MNKPRPSALPLKKAIRVSPPTAPGFFSFHSFRVKKGSSSKQDKQNSSENTNRRRTSSGDSNHFERPTSSSSWASAVVSPLAYHRSLSSNNYDNQNQAGNGHRLSTFKTFSSSGQSAPCSPCVPDYRFVNEPPPNHNLVTTTEVVDIHAVPSSPSSALIEDGCISGASQDVIFEMHKGYYHHDKNVNSSSLNETNDLHGKPPSGVIRHHTLRSNSEPHGHTFNNTGYGGGPGAATTDLGGNSGSNNHNHGLSGIYGSHIVLEDQGIDMSQSPGHESPSSTVSSNTVSVSGGSGVSSSIGSGGSTSGGTGSRHSAASFDSGRASSSLYQQGVRYSGLSSESSSTGSCRHSYHSSSSSLGSIPPEEICNFDVSSMIAQGLPDSEILNAWLTGVHFECYYQNFIQAGYDMHTIVKMTPEDLNAIGITKPNHRKRLKSEISQLIIPSDGLPDYIPSTVEEWLRALRMEEYTDKLKAQGYTNVRQVTNITWEDLEDIGILKLGHQKKFLLAIKRVEDILSGKRLHCVGVTGTGSGSQNPYHSVMDHYAVPNRQMPYPNQGSHGHHPQPPPTAVARGYLNSLQQKAYQNQHPPFSTWRQNSVPLTSKDQELHSYHQNYNNHTGEGIYGTTGGTSATDKPHLQLLTHQPQIHPEKKTCNGLSGPPGSQPEYHPEVIAIHVKNDRRPSAIAADHCGEPIYGTSSFQAQPPQPCQNSLRTSKWLEDGETTPTNEVVSATSGYLESASGVSSVSTLPRLMKHKMPLKTGASEVDSGLDITYHQPDPSAGPSLHQWQQQHQQQMSQSMDGYKSLPKNMGRFQSTFASPSSQRNSTSGAIRQPPPPPRRSSSAIQQQDTFSTFHPGKPQSTSSWGTSTSTGGEDLPAPPPPEDLALMGGHNDNPPGPAPEKSSTASNPSSFTNGTSSSSSSSSSTSLVSSSTTNRLSSTDYHLQHHHHHYNNYNNSSANTNTSTNAPFHNNNSSSSSVNHSNARIHPSTNNTTNTTGSAAGSGSGAAGAGRLRDPSPGGSDGGGGDLTATFATVGVRRNGSDASFKSSSSTESESIPFANDNAGTIKQQKNGSRTASGAGIPLDGLYGATRPSTSSGEVLEAGDVLSDIGNMLADLTDELDAILQQEMDSLNKR